MKDNKFLKWILMDGLLIVVIVAMGIAIVPMQKKLKAVEKKADSLQISVNNAENNLKKLETGDTSEEAEPSPSSETEEKDISEEETTPEPTVVEVADMNELSDLLRPVIEGYEASGTTWSYYIEDAKSGARAEYKSEQMQASNLIELYIMGAVYENYDKLGGSSLDVDLMAMIADSDDAAADKLVKVLGGGDENAGRDAVNKFCKENKYSDTDMGRLLQADQTTGDNVTSVSDCCAFLKSIYDGKIDHAEDMLNLLKNQKNTSKIPNGLPTGIETANKTGELTGVENDAAIIYGNQNDYILCIMTENVGDTETVQQNIAEVSQSVYGYFNYAVKEN